jgi:SnoaL-like protein
MGNQGTRRSTHDADLATRIRQHWEAAERGDIDAEHAIYASDAVLDYPQSGERFVGRPAIQAQRGGHPAERHFSVRRIQGGGDLWISECVITYDGAPTYSVSVMALTDGLVTHETQYFADPFKAPADRALLAQPIPARDDL